MLEGLRKMKHVIIESYKYFTLTLSRVVNEGVIRDVAGEVGRGKSWKALGTLFMGFNFFSIGDMQLVKNFN